MKKIIIETEESKIHLSEVTVNDYILVKKVNKIFGVIIRDDCEDWCLRRASEDFEYNKNLVDLLKLELFKDCEFYVLD